VSLQVVNGLEGGVGIITLVAQELANLSPVLLLDMSVVVLLVRAGLG
jgi:hypothetical protein